MVRGSVTYCSRTADAASAPASASAETLPMMVVVLNMFILPDTKAHPWMPPHYRNYGRCSRAHKPDQ